MRTRGSDTEPPPTVGEERERGEERNGRREDDRRRAGIERRRRVGAEVGEPGRRGDDGGGRDRSGGGEQGRVVSRAPAGAGGARRPARIAAQLEGGGDVDRAIEGSGDEPTGERPPAGRG